MTDVMEGQSYSELMCRRLGKLDAVSPENLL